MKLLFCVHCRDTVCMTTENETRSCKCKKTGGKYLKDRITAVITEDSVVFGIDNNSFINALATIEKIWSGEYSQFKEGQRYDFFFTGWIPTVPGEVIRVKSLAHVKATDYYQEKSWTSQNPSTDINEVAFGI